MWASVLASARPARRLDSLERPLVAEEAKGFAHRGVEVGSAFRRIFRLHEVEEAVAELHNAERLALQRHHGRAQVLGHLLLEGMGVVHDRRHRIAKLVQEHGDEPAGAREPLRLRALLGDLDAKPFEFDDGAWGYTNGVDQVQLWAFSVDWSSGNSSFTPVADLPLPRRIPSNSRAASGDAVPRSFSA